MDSEQRTWYSPRHTVGDLTRTSKVGHVTCSGAFGGSTIVIGGSTIVSVRSGINLEMVLGLTCIVKHDSEWTP